MKRARWIAALVPVLCLTSCLSVKWQRRRAYDAVTDEQLEQLQAEDADLAGVLESLGAPLDVREYQRAGMVLSYGWSSSETWGVGLSVPVAESLSASVNYDQLDASSPGVVLFLDGDLRLVRWRRGLLGDLTRDLDRPAPGPPLDPPVEKDDEAQDDLEDD